MSLLSGGWLQPVLRGLTDVTGSCLKKTPILEGAIESSKQKCGDRDLTQKGMKQIKN